MQHWSTAIVDGRSYSVNLYGDIVGAEINVLLPHSSGVIQCRLRRKISGGKLAIEADMWQSQAHGTLDGTFTSFSVSVDMVPAGNKYIVASRYYHNANDFWKELETLISNEIIVNE